jgi:hypothetical protein
MMMGGLNTIHRGIDPRARGCVFYTWKIISLHLQGLGIYMTCELFNCLTLIIRSSLIPALDTLLFYYSGVEISSKSLLFASNNFPI